mgnify:FL=1
MLKENEVKRIILGTGSYDTVKFGNTVSITGDGGNAWNYFGPAYKKLAPRLMTYLLYADALKDLEKIKDSIPIEEYTKKKRKIEFTYIKSYYETRLKNLEMEDFLKTLEAKFGTNIVFLCHEPVNEFCHRRVLADYIELQTGVYIPEVKIMSNDEFTLKQPLNYKQELKRVMKL